MLHGILVFIGLVILILITIEEGWSGFINTLLFIILVSIGIAVPPLGVFMLLMVLLF